MNQTPKPSNPLAQTALVLVIVAGVLAIVPVASFVAWLPALAGCVLGIVSLVTRRPRTTKAAVSVGAGLLAWLIAIIVSIGSLVAVGAASSNSPASTIGSSSAEEESADEGALESPRDPATAQIPSASPSATEPTALELLATIPIKGRAPKTGYDRSGQYGSAWLDVDRNGCDTRNDILRRDLHDLTLSGTCKVTSGQLEDPYTGKSIDFVRGNTTSMAVQIDHVVSLMNSWETGAQQLTQTQRIALANDPLNLWAVDQTANAQKGAGDAATWLPPVKSFRCEYVARQVSVKATYGLWVTQPEHDAIVRILTSCPDQVATSSPLNPVAKPTVEPSPEPSAPAPAAPLPFAGDVDPPAAPVYFKNCAAARAAGAAPVHLGDPGYAKHLDRDGDGIGCET